jgi:septation ring formation regulator EzrA
MWNTIRLADEWLWMPYSKFSARLSNRRERSRDIAAYRKKKRLAMQRLRARRKQEARAREIAAVYRSEINRRC